MPIHLLGVLASIGHPGSPVQVAWPGEGILSGHGEIIPISVVAKRGKALKQAVSGCC